MKLTRRVIDEEIKKLAAGNRDREILWDAEISGFGVRLTRKGGAYFLNYRNAAGSERRMTLGTLGELTIEAARKKAAQTKVDIRAGADPLGEIRAKAAAPEPTKGLTLRQISARFLETGKPGWSKRTHDGYGYTFEKHLLPTLGDKPAAEITKVEIAEMSSKTKTKSAAAAANALRVLGSCLRWAEDLQLIDEARLPRTRRTAPPVAPRERLASDEEVVKLWKAADGLEPGEAAAAKLIILTVLRTDVVNKLQAEWLKDKTFHLPARVMKNKRTHQVPIAPWAMPLVAPCLELPRRKVSRILVSLRALAGIPDVDFHDLRRSFRTWCGKNGIAKDHAEFALAHISHQTDLDKTYDKHTYIEEASRALLAWQEHIRLILKLPSDAPQELAA